MHCGDRVLPSLASYESNRLIDVPLTAALLIVYSFIVLCCCAGALEDGMRCGDRALPSLASYESNVLYVLRFMVDTNMGGGQWLEIPAGAFASPYIYSNNPM